MKQRRWWKVWKGERYFHLKKLLILLRVCELHVVWLVHAVSYSLHIQHCSIYILLMVSTPPILNLCVLRSRCPFWLHSLDNNAVEPFSKNISFKTISETAFYKKERTKEILGSACLCTISHINCSHLSTKKAQKKWPRIKFSFQCFWIGGFKVNRNKWSVLF